MQKGLRNKTILLMLCAFVLLLANINTAYSQSIDTETSSQAIKDAEKSLLQAYENVLEAEKAKANISELVDALNLAAHYFELAIASNDTGNPTAAWNNATLCMEITQRIKGDAVKLGEEASKKTTQRIVLTAILSLTGIIVVSLAGLCLWAILKQRYGETRKLYFLILASVVLLDFLMFVPFASFFFSFPRSGESFSEIWILDSEGQAIRKPLESPINKTATLFLGVRNYMGSLSYYVVRVKFANETKQLPSLFGSMPSELKRTYEFHLFVRNEEMWENKVSVKVSDASFFNNKCIMKKLAVNNMLFNVNNSLSWNQTKRGFYYYMFFELWHYNRTSKSLQYHERYVWLPLNITKTV